MAVTNLALKEEPRQHEPTPAAALNAMFSRTTERHSETMYEGGCVLFHLDTFTVVEEERTSCFLCF